MQGQKRRSLNTDVYLYILSEFMIINQIPDLIENNGGIYKYNFEHNDEENIEFIERIDQNTHFIFHFDVFYFHHANIPNITFRNKSIEIDELIVEHTDQERIEDYFDPIEKVKIKSIFFKKYYGHPLPQKTESLNSTGKSNSPNKSICSLNDALTKITFWREYKFALPDILPPNLQEINFQSTYEFELPANLPENLKKLIISTNYTHKLPVKKIFNAECKQFDTICGLPEKMEHLEINRYNKPLPEKLPSLKHLILKNFMGKLPKKLPETLKTFHLDSQNDQIIPDFPASIESLVFGTSFNQPLHPNLPPQLKELIFGHLYSYPIPHILPESLVHMEFSSYYDHPLPPKLPSNLQVLIFGYKYDHPLPSILPDTLRYIEFGSYYNKPLPKKLPSQLREIRFDTRYNIKLPEHLPESLRKIVFGYCFNKNLPEKLPEKLEKLKFDHCFNKPLPKRLPNNLKKLILGFSYNHPLPDISNTQLKVIRFGKSQQFELNEFLPTSLERIELYNVNCKKIIGGRYSVIEGVLHRNGQNIGIKVIPRY